MLRKPITFGMKLGAGFAASISAALIICAASIYGLNETVRSSHAVISDYSQDLITAGRLRAEEEGQVASSRGYLITGDSLYTVNMKKERENFVADLGTLINNNPLPMDQDLLKKIMVAENSYQEVLDRFIKARQVGVSLDAIKNHFETDLQPKRNDLELAVNNYLDFTRDQLRLERDNLNRKNKRIFTFVVIASVAGLILALMFAYFVTKTLSQLFSRAQLTSQMRQEFIEMIAHDLKNPISAIAINTSMMLKDAPSDNVRRRGMRITRATDQMSGLVQRLLDMAKLEAGTLYIEKRKTSPNDILDEVLDLFIPIVKANGLEIKSQANDLPNINCDHGRVAEVLSNLIDNAIKYSPPEGLIEIGATSRSDGVEFFVKDHGKGIPLEEQSHIFDRYWQRSPSKKSSAGLGLAICKGIVEQHGGKIWVQSLPEAGATFRFIIPFQEARAYRKPERDKALES